MKHAVMMTGYIVFSLEFNMHLRVPPTKSPNGRCMLQLLFIDLGQLSIEPTLYHYFFFSYMLILVC